MFHFSFFFSKNKTIPLKLNCIISAVNKWFKIVSLRHTHFLLYKKHPTATLARMLELRVSRREAGFCFISFALDGISGIQSEISKINKAFMLGLIETRPSSYTLIRIYKSNLGYNDFNRKIFSDKSLFLIIFYAKKILRHILRTRKIKNKIIYFSLNHIKF